METVPTDPGEPLSVYVNVSGVALGVASGELQ